MSDLSKLTVCVRDTGYFTSFAERLSRDFGTVLYHNPSWKIGSPKSQPGQMGKGLADNLEIALDFWDAVKKSDMVAIPDIYDGDTQVQLRELGIPVFGSGEGEDLEIDRWETKLLLEELGLNVPASELIEGVDALETYLQEHDDLWIKRPRWRGDFETWHHSTMFMSQQWFDKLKKDLGPSGEKAEFIVEADVKGVEIGFDGLIVDGSIPDVVSYGYEIKDAAHVGRFRPYSEFPEAIQKINAAMMPEFAKYEYRGLYSNEIRIAEKDEKAYMIDPTCRFASPAGELLCEGFTNFSEVIWAAANGEILTPEIKYGYGAAVNLYSENALSGWLPVQIPEEYRTQIKLHYHSRFDEVDYVTPPTHPISLVGVVVAMAPTLGEAISEVLEIAGEVQMPGKSIDEAAFDTAEEVIEEGEKLGINWK